MRSSLAPRRSLPWLPTWPLPLTDMPRAGGARTDRRSFSWRTAAGRRSNLLLEGPADSFAAAIRELSADAEGPVRYRTLPGKLDLPSAPVRTLILHDVAALTKSQQVALFDWLSTRAGDTQVISMTSASLPSMVAEGEFLEALYYRLNVIRVDFKGALAGGTAADWETRRPDVG